MTDSTPIQNVTKQSQGFRFGVRCCAFAAIATCILNLILTIVAVTKYGMLGGLGTLQIGDCNTTKRLSQWLHLLINILSTILLGASNYSMQGLSSPTRQMIDEAHQRGVWLDIGVPSVRNIRWLSRPRITIWCLLAFSSIPLHLIYNSAVFETLIYQAYSAFVVADTFPTGATFSLPSNGTNSGFNFTYFDYSSQSRDTAQSLLESLQSQIPSLQRLDNRTCMDTFNDFSQSTYTDVLLVSSQGDAPNSVLGVAGTFGAGASYEDLTMKMNVATPQTPLFGRYPISYCLAKSNSRCRLQFSLVIMVIVILCNAIKALCMANIVWKHKSEGLITIGDAIASFLEIPDPTTSTIPLADKYHPTKLRSRDEGAPKEYHARPYLWFSSASRRRWFTTILICLAMLLATMIGLISERSSNGGPSLASLGFGATSGSTLIEFKSSMQSSLVAMVMLANSPQLVLSILYFNYNSLFTCMLLAKEWSGYAHKRKGLRVTAPRGEQRSTYRLQVPYRYGVPLLIFSGLLHWLVSQSLFLVRASAFNDAGDLDPKYDISTCGYSPSAILVTIIVGIVILVLVFVNGFRSYSPGMPLAGSCSTAISAACHPPKGDENPSTKTLMWGLCNQDTSSNGEENGQSSSDRFSFTSFEVQNVTIDAEAVKRKRNVMYDTEGMRNGGKSTRQNVTLLETDALPPRSVAFLNSIGRLQAYQSTVGHAACECIICQVDTAVRHADKPFLRRDYRHSAAGRSSRSRLGSR